MESRITHGQTTSKSPSRSRSQSRSFKDWKTKEGNTSDDEEQVAGASISSRVNSPQSECLAEYDQTGSCAGKLYKTDIRSNGQGKKRKKELFSDTSRPQLVAPVINPSWMEHYFSLLMCLGCLHELEAVLILIYWTVSGFLGGKPSDSRIVTPSTSVSRWKYM